MSESHMEAGALAGLRAVLVAGLVILACSQALAATRNVPEDYLTIQAAIDSAGAGDTVLIAAGTYTGPGNRGIELHGKDIVVRSSDGPSETIIDCQQQGRGFYIHEWEPATARVEGFTIRNGLVAPGTPPFDSGAGILYLGTSVAIVDCRIEACYAYGDGGGMFLLGFDETVERCVFFGNHGSRGGGIFCQFTAAPLANCVTQDNSAMVGGGICSEGSEETRLDGCTIAGNMSNEGGGIWISDLLHLERCIVWDNCAQGDDDEIRCGPADILCSDIDRSGVSSGTVNYDADCIDTDPMFCVPRACGGWGYGDLLLSESSPCLPANSPCGALIGAVGAGCGPSFPPGACCLPDGCTVMSASLCGQLGGTYLGDGVACDPDPCVPTAIRVTTWGRIKAAYR